MLNIDIGIAGMFENMRTNTQALANLHGETAKNLNGTVLPILARLHKEIKAKAKELTDGAYKGAKTVETAQNTTQKWIESLGQHSAVFDSAGGKIEPVNDPYLLQRGIQYRLHKQVLEENNNRQDIISVQRNFEGFETHVVQTLQQAMGQFLQFVGGQADRQKAMYSDIVGTVQRIPPEFEWMNFLHRSGNLLIDPASPARDVKSITYANQTHASTKPLIAGTLERKSRALGKLGGYKTHYYAVTPAKYLHQFADDDNFRKDPAPELTLYLPDCTIGAVADTKFNIKGKDASKGKVGSYVQMNHELAFKAHTPSDAQQWHAIISKCSGTTTTEPPNSAITSPVTPTAPANPITGDKRVASNPPEYTDKQPAPLQIEGLPGQTTEQTTGVTSEDFAPQSTSTAATGAGTSAGATGAAPQSAGVLPSPTTPATTTTTSPDAAVLGKETAK